MFKTTFVVRVISQTCSTSLYYFIHSVDMFQTICLVWEIFETCFRRLQLLESSWKHVSDAFSYSSHLVHVFYTTLTVCYILWTCSRRLLLFELSNRHVREDICCFKHPWGTFSCLNHPVDVLQTTHLVQHVADVFRWFSHLVHLFNMTIIVKYIL